MAKAATSLVRVPAEAVERRIYLIRGLKVMLDSDLASLYGVSTSQLNLAVHRNTERFPPDFMFQLTRDEVEGLRLQIETSNSGRGGRRYRPYVFTEHGVAMLSAVLRSKHAVQMSILVVRAFVRLREIVASNKELAARIRSLESSRQKHASLIGILFEEIKTIKPLSAPAKKIGFKV